MPCRHARHEHTRHTIERERRAARAPQRHEGHDRGVLRTRCEDIQMPEMPAVTLPRRLFRPPPPVPSPRVVAIRTKRITARRAPRAVRQHAHHKRAGWPLSNEVVTNRPPHAFCHSRGLKQKARKKRYNHGGMTRHSAYREKASRVVRESFPSPSQARRQVVAALCASQQEGAAADMSAAFALSPYASHMGMHRRCHAACPFTPTAFHVTGIRTTEGSLSIRKGQEATQSGRPGGAILRAAQKQRT